MRLIVWLLCVCSASFVLAQEKRVVTVSELELTKPPAESLTVEQFEADYQKLMKTGECVERKSFQLTMWDDREFDFAQMASVDLLDRILESAGKQARVYSHVKLGYQWHGSIVSENEKFKLKLEYEGSFVEKLTDDTKTSDLVSISANYNAEITAGKPVVIKANTSEGTTFLRITLLPQRAARMLR